ncbi:MAG: pyruvate kinase [Eggerthellaceae bacterium]|nr:pyruvate kinase [Eggerthellaceae bacterium]
MEHQAKRTKIICTMGPAVDSEVTLHSLVEEGMDIARLNFSHGTREEQLARINRLKKVRRELDAPTAILMDMRGPGIRTGALAGGKPIRLQAGKRITLTNEDVPGTDRLVHQSFPGLHSYMKPGTSILIDDGLIELAVDEIRGTDIVCTVQNTGILGEHKSLNFPGTTIDLPILTDGDEADLLFGARNDVDYVAVPCVRSASDIQTVRTFLQENDGGEIGLIAKIERPEAVENIDEIIAASDGILVARGDLGVEMDTAEVPHIQKRLIALCNQARIPVIVASQMLDSMVREPRPTRAEVTDVANAIYDGADALMLSTETALGKYPLPALRTMVKIALSSEQHSTHDIAIPLFFDSDAANVSPAVGKAAVQAARDVHAECIVTPTTSGRTARLISKLRPEAPIYAVASSEKVMRRMQLFWGVTPMTGGADRAGMRETIETAQRIVLEKGLVKVGDLAVFTAGDPHTSPVLETDGQARSHAGTSVMYVVQIRDTRNEAR